MVLVVKTNPNGLPLRHYAVPAIALSLATTRAMDADVEDAVIWKHHPDLAFVCIRTEGNDLVLNVGQPYCRRGVVELLDGVDPFETSAKLVRYSAEYDSIGLLIRASGPDAILEIVIYAPGVANLLKLPPIDAMIDVNYFGDAKVKTFYDLFRHDYERYVEFVRRLAEELRPMAVSIEGRRAELPPTYFVERLDASQDVYDYRDITRTVPLYRHRFIDSVVSDVIWRFKPRHPVDVQLVWNDVYEVAKKTFAWVGDLLLPKSPEAYDEFVSHIVDKVLRRGATP